jgi:hypothetical protein
VAGGVLGLSLALAVLLASRPGAAGSPLPASVNFSLAPTGALEARPAPPQTSVLRSSLRPGGRAGDGRFSLRNQSGGRLRVSLRARPDSTALDGLLRLRLRQGSRLLADTTLQGLASHPASFALASGERARFQVRAWIPAEIRGGAAGALVRVALVPSVQVIGGRR